MGDNNIRNSTITTSPKHHYGRMLLHCPMGGSYMYAPGLTKTSLKPSILTCSKLPQSAWRIYPRCDVMFNIAANELLSPSCGMGFSLLWKRVCPFLVQNYTVIAINIINHRKSRLLKVWGDRIDCAVWAITTFFCKLLVNPVINCDLHTGVHVLGQAITVTLTGWAHSENINEFFIANYHMWATR